MSPSPGKASRHWTHKAGHFFRLSSCVSPQKIRSCLDKLGHASRSLNVSGFQAAIEVQIRRTPPDHVINTIPLNAK